MKLSKAIELTEDHNRFHPRVQFPDEFDAFELLTEAGKRIQVGRNNPGSHWNDPLPGETED